MEAAPALRADPGELVALSTAGRVFTERVRVGPADVGPTGRARLGAVACWLQDVAYHDVVDGGVDGAGFWIVRRTRIRVETFPRFTEELELQTFCSAISRAIAERRTSIRGGLGAAVEAVSVWVNVDPQTHLPARLPPAFVETYEPASERKPRSRLRHPAPSAGAQARAWPFREDDLDMAGHVNNARYWAVVDSHLAEAAGEAPLDVEVEHRGPALVGEAMVLTAERLLWVTTPGAPEEVCASAVVLD